MSISLRIPRAGSLVALATVSLAACGHEPAGPDLSVPVARSLATAAAPSTGTLLGIARTGASTGVDFVAIDPATGTMQVRGAVPLNGSIFGGAAYDADGQRYFTSGPGLADRSGLYLATIDAASGAASLAASPYPMTSTPTAIAYDPASRTVIGSARVDGQLRAVRVDPATGGITPFALLPICGVSGKGAIDPAGGRYFVVGPESCMGGELVIATVHLATGSVAVSPAIRPYLNGMVYDPVQQAVLGLSRVRPGAEMQLVRVDLTTGTLTEVANLPIQGLSSAAAALDPVGRRYFAVGPVGMMETALAVVDLETGATLHSPVITVVPQSLQFQPAAAAEPSIPGLVADVEALLAAGALAAGQADALISKLSAARSSLERDQVQGAIGQLQSFVNQCEALVRARVLTAAQGQALIDAATAVLQQIRSR